MQQPIRQLSQDEVRKTRSQLRNGVARLEGRKILVVGDVGLDEYLDGDVRRISPEAPVPVVEVRARDHRVGLAANVAQNVHSLGGVAHMVGIVGNDPAAKNLSDLLRAVGVADGDLVVDSDRPTTRKVRVMSGQHHIVRVDFEAKAFVSQKVSEALLRNVEKRLNDVDGLIIEDYGKGALSEDVCQKIISAAKAKGKRVVVDPHRTTPIRYYRGADVIKPNRDEAFILSGLNIDDLRMRPDSVVEVAKSIQKQTGASAVLITEGKDGATLLSGSDVQRIPTEPRQVFDVTGAGDTYVATFSLAWFAGFSQVEAAILANAASGVVVGKIGCVPCSKDELLASL